jgi:type VI protein secretion system component VasK
MKLANIILSVITALLSVYVFYVCIQFPEVVDSVPGPGIWPRAVSICLFVVSLFLLFRTIFSKKDRNEKENVPDSDNSQEKTRVFLNQKMFRVYIMMGIAVVYLGLMMLAGFIIATALFIAVIMIFMDEKKILFALAVGLGSSLGMYFLFYQVFRIILPPGLLFG